MQFWPCFYLSSIRKTWTQEHVQITKNTSDLLIIINICSLHVSPCFGLTRQLLLQVHVVIGKRKWFSETRMIFAACWDKRSRLVFPVSKRLVPEECKECISLSVDLAAQWARSCSVCRRSQEGTVDQEGDSRLTLPSYPFIHQNVSLELSMMDERVKVSNSSGGCPEVGPLPGSEPPLPCLFTQRGTFHLDVCFMQAAVKGWGGCNCGFLPVFLYFYGGDEASAVCCVLWACSVHSCQPIKSCIGLSGSCSFFT